MKNYLTAGMGFRRLVRLFRRNSVSLLPKFLIRHLFLFQSAIWTDLFTRIERKKYAKKISETPLPEDPIFIIGHWRTGTTLLHQLFSLDPQFATPTLFQVAEPGCFIVAYPYYLPVFTALVPKRRPMDNVALGMNEPQEEEYAIYRMTDFSPLENLVFPKDRGYFITEVGSFLPAGNREKEIWMEQIGDYYKKLSYYYHGKTIVSKNPFNSFRIRELTTLFPRARFIHLVRHPFEVVPSAVNMWKIVQDQNALNRNGRHPGIDDVAEGLNRVLTTIERDLSEIPPDRRYVMRFEELDDHPVREMKKMYEWFRLPFTEKVEKAMESYSEKVRTYQKNEFLLKEEDKEVIRDRVRFPMKSLGYK